MALSELDALPDLQMENFSFLPIDEGVIAKREGSCFCNPCFGVRGRGLGTADSNLRVHGCRCSHLPSRQWKEQEVQRRDAQGIAECACARICDDVMAEV